jgi:hypothetical protein
VITEILQGEGKKNPQKFASWKGITSFGGGGGEQQQHIYTYSGIKYCRNIQILTVM